MLRPTFLLLLLAVSTLLLVAASCTPVIPDQDWGHTLVDATHGAYEFWWLHGMQDTSKRDAAPLIFFLQGGPGASSMFGDLCELGPIDACDGNPKARPFAWNRLANLIFVDQPVGTGFSYVEKESGYVQTEEQIADHFLILLASILQKYPLMQTIPMYIFGESYGGKMAANIGVALVGAIAQGRIKCSFHGVALGNSWISPIDHVSSYGVFLEAIGHLNPTERSVADKYAAQIKVALDEHRFTNATSLWGAQQGYISTHTANANWYNFLQHSSQNLYNLTQYVNNVLRPRFKISKTWSMSSGKVFHYLSADFMQPAIDKVDFLLQKGFQVIVYSGQLDIIVDTMSTNAWIQKLTWDGLSGFNNTEKQTLRGNGIAFKLTTTAQEQYYPGITGSGRDEPDIIGSRNYAFVQRYKNLSMYTILYSGHMVPMDNPAMALEMLKHVLLK